MATLYTRVRELQERGLDAPALFAALEKEGVPRADVQLVLASVRNAAAPPPGFVPPSTRVLDSRAAFAVVLVALVLMLGLVWELFSVIIGGRAC